MLFWTNLSSGMQGQLWTELVRTSDQMDSMIFPRLLAVAERSWHEAPWESINNDNDRKETATINWTEFAQTLGCKELRRLDTLNVAYHLNPPGAR